MSLSKEEQLESIYRRIPDVRCKGLCQNYCGPLQMTRLERKRIVKVVGQAPRADLKTFSCVMLDDQGRCRCYATRPLICRLWGAVKSLACPHGCRPDRWLTVNEVMRIVEDIGKIGGPMVLDPMVAEVNRLRPDEVRDVAARLSIQAHQEAVAARAEGAASDVPPVRRPTGGACKPGSSSSPR